MNEEIDVSECAFYSNGKCSNPNGMACNCRNTAICYFKELKRLEFENKLLKADYEASEAENAKLKELLETRCYNEVEFENKKLKEKVDKIKEIAETALKANYCNNCDGVGLPECQDTECHTYALDKIMDVLEGAEDE